jgi:O-antigen/teichoic acid export membrane protein
MIKKHEYNRKKATITQAFGGYILTGIGLFQGLLLLPIYLSYIEVGAYGYWLTINSLLAIINIFNFGVNEIVVPHMAKSYADKDYDNLLSYFTTSMIIYTVICIVYVIFCSVAYLFLNKILFIDPQNISIINKCFIIAMITTVLIILNQSLADFSNATLSPKFQIITRIFTQIMGVGITIFLVINEYGILSIPIGLLVSEVSCSIVSSFYVCSKIKSFKKTIRLNISHLSNILNPGLATFSATIGNKLFDEAPQLIITNSIGAEMTTAYVVTRKIAETILRLVRISVISLLASFTNMVTKEGLQKQHDVTKIILFIATLSSFIGFSMYVFLNKSFVALWISKSIELDQNVILFIGFGTFLFSLVELFKYLHYGLKNFKYPAYLSFIGGVITTCLSLLFIHSLNILAIPMSCMIGAGIILLLSSFNFYKLMKMPIKAKSIIRTAMFLISVIVFGNIIENYGGSLTWIDLIRHSILVSFLLFSITIIFYHQQILHALKVLRGK